MPRCAGRLPAAGQVVVADDMEAEYAFKKMRCKDGEWAEALKYSETMFVEAVSPCVAIRLELI